MKIWVAYLVPKDVREFGNPAEEGISFMAASQIGEDDAEAVLLRQIKEDYGVKDTLEIYKGHRLHVRMLELFRSKA